MTVTAIEALAPDFEHPGTTLARIQRLVDELFCEPMNVARVFGSQRLDALCQKVGRGNLQRIGLAHPPAPDEAVTVYIASRLQASGGHTAALRDVIRLAPPHRSVILLTDTCGRTRRADVRARFGDLPQVEVEYAPPGSHLHKLTWLQQRLQALHPGSVWLFNHHQDSVAVAAVQPDRGYRVHYYHHGDDRLSLGVYLGYGRHFDSMPLPFHNCRDAVRVHDNEYLPLTVPDLGETTYGSDGPEGLVTCTAAGFNKLEVEYFVQYVDVVPEILRITRGRHVHIGRLSPQARWRIRRRLRELGVPSSAFVYIPYVPSVWRSLQEHGVDLYLASFPYGAGRTLVEVMGSGIPAVLHRHCTSRMIGGLDMAYDGAWTWRDPQELYAMLRGADRQTLRQQGRLARAWYEKYHREEIVVAALGDAELRVEVPALKTDYAPDPVLQAWQTAREVSISGVVKRRLWFAWRQAKAYLGRAV
jgi:hypothetical protein